MTSVVNASAAGGAGTAATSLPSGPAERQIVRSISKHTPPDEADGGWRHFVGRYLRDLIVRVSRSSQGATDSPTSTAWQVRRNGGISASGNAPLAPSAGKPGNPLSHALQLLRKVKRGELTGDEMNDKLMEGLGYQKRRLRDGRTVWSQQQI